MGGETSKSGQYVASVLVEVHHPWAEPVIVEAEPDHVRRRENQVFGDAEEEHRRCGVGGDEVPTAVHDDRRIAMSTDDQVDQIVDLPRGGVVRGLLVGRRVDLRRAGSCLRSRRGTSGCSHRCSTTSGLGRLRPVST